MPAGPGNIKPSEFLSRYGYHPKDLANDAARRVMVAKAVADLARERYGGDVAAAAKRTAKHVGHIASYLTHRSPVSSARMRGNQRWLKETYYPPAPMAAKTKAKTKAKRARKAKST
jgi:hypothetical protein